ncbi:27706_t:CDS:2 [Gigaspora margarita]|uniref:27706_t:CDS:1 n=1 Tax=Gigaspora margarita TaxID=4874 RepID=A0ABN7UGN6_GIGMA|nr:27706_t:CDS:2 [Gigaspora margarita]
MSNNEDINNNEYSREIALVKSHWEVDDNKDENLVLQEISNDKSEPSEEITSHFEASYNISVSSGSEVSSENQLHVLKFTFASAEVEYNNSDDKQNTSSFRHEESSDDDSDNSESDDSNSSMHYYQISVIATSTNLVSNFSSNTQIVKTMQHIIYDSLFEYWNEPKMVGLLAMLLGPCLKTLSNWDEETQEKAKTELLNQFKSLILSNYEQTPIYSYLTNSNICYNCLHSSIFGTSAIKNTTSGPLAELEQILKDFNQTGNFRVQNKKERILCNLLEANDKIKSKEDELYYNFEQTDISSNLEIMKSFIKRFLLKRKSHY